MPILKSGERIQGRGEVVCLPYSVALKGLSTPITPSGRRGCPMLGAVTVLLGFVCPTSCASYILSVGVGCLGGKWIPVSYCPGVSDVTISHLQESDRLYASLLL
jgi:hypothetical protein